MARNSPAQAGMRPSGVSISITVATTNIFNREARRGGAGNGVSLVQYGFGGVCGGAGLALRGDGGGVGCVGLVRGGGGLDLSWYGGCIGLAQRRGGHRAADVAILLHDLIVEAVERLDSFPLPDLLRTF